MWLIEKIKSYFQTRAQLKRQRLTIERALAHVRSGPMAEPPTTEQAIRMYDQVSVIGCVVSFKI